MGRGRPVKSQIRQNILEILHYLGKGYGYQISKVYNEIFPRVTQRVIYYHLKKGMQTKEIIVHTIQQEKGDFSWGSVVEKKYYALGDNALPKGEKRVEEFLKSREFSTGLGSVAKNTVRYGENSGSPKESGRAERACKK